MKLKLAEEEDELLFLYKTRTNPEIDKMLTGSPPKDYSSHIKYFNSVQGKVRWIFIAYIDNDMVGYSQIYDITDTSCEVGFAISPNFQGKGFGKSLVLATINKARNFFKNKKIVLYVLKTNSKAISVYNKVGFKEQELKNSSEEIMGMVLDICVDI
jgi:RimJ/RimL family protein N-acetyltransferase